MRSRWIIAAVSLLLGLSNTQAQLLPEFNMADTTVTICKGILLDSEAGPGGNIYGNNEDFVFTIDAGGVITMTFDPMFCTEQGLDILTFHDGPTIASPQIGPGYSGIIPPPTIVANSGFLTVHFVSDANVAYCGWEAQWTTEVPPPVPPTMSVPTPPACGSSTINVQFSGNIPCPSVVLSAFDLTGTAAPNILTATPIGCVDDSTTTVQLTVDEPFDRNCPYDIAFDLELLDRCDSVHLFTLSTNFLINACPVGVKIQTTQDTLCAGGCTLLTAIAEGCLSYTYAWSPSLAPTAGPHAVCPTSNSTYTVTITEVGTGNTASASVTLVVADPQIQTPDTTLCQSVAPFALGVSPSGGIWDGPGVTDDMMGIFDPDTSGPGMHTIYYQLAGGCMDSVLIDVLPMDAGLDEAACPGTAPFFVSGSSPPGGTWSGPIIQPNGLFDPDSVGSFVVTYTFGGCSDIKTINVDTLNTPLGTDTVCQSVFPFDIMASPFGGIWSGVGIVDTVYGTFDPDEAGGGTHINDYALHGCAQQYPIHVLGIQAGNNKTACPSQGQFVITPAATPSGGTWNGSGIVNATTGLYDPALAGGGGNVTDWLTYAAPNGCVDTLRMIVRWTDIGIDTAVFCLDDGPFDLDDDDNTDRTPCCGVWSGPGVFPMGGNNYELRPNVAGVGVHVVYYDKNTCQDSMTVIVYPAQLSAGNSTVCETEPPFVIEQFPFGAQFFGPGINDPFSALFDPADAGVGVHTVHYLSPALCVDSVVITVVQFQTATITGAAAQYCSNDTLIQLSVEPSNGIFTGLPDTLFNPSMLPPGTYTLVNTVGSGTCASSDTVVFVNHAPLSTMVSVSEDSICGGGGTTMSVMVSGGDPNGSPTFNWSDGLFPVNSHTVSPTSTHVYWVNVSDGCSDPITDTIPIWVFPEFDPQYLTSPQQCYGEPGFVVGSVAGSGNYSFTWNTTPSQITDSLIAIAGQSFTVLAQNLDTGCDHDSLITIPSWPAITALFSTNPTADCIPFDQGEVTFIDLSNNAVSGTWDINGQLVPYQYGENPVYDLGGSGNYSVQLVVFNQGGCSDTMALDVCILDPTPVFVPDAFSPNGDGNNDVLFVRGPGIIAMSFTVYDRWGSMVFESQHPDHGWDGRSRSGQMPSGIYLYVMKAALNDGEDVELKGNVTLVR